MSSPLVGPSNPEQPSSSAPSVWARVGNFVGYVFKTILYLPVNLVLLIVRISKATADIFRGSPQKASTVIEHDVAKSVTPNSNSGHVGAVHQLGVATLEQGKKESPAEPPKDEDKKTEAPAEATAEKPAGPGLQPPQSTADPLSAMGAVAHSIPPASSSVISAGPVPSISQEDEVIQDLAEVEQIIVPAGALLAKNVLPNDYFVMAKALINEHHLLNVYASQNLPAPAQKRLQDVILAMEKKIAEIGDNILKPVQTTLTMIAGKQPVMLQGYLAYKQQLYEQFESLEPYLSLFEPFDASIHKKIKNGRAELTRAIDRLDVDMCKLIKGKYKPNTAIPGSGNCLFESVRHQLGSKHDQQSYRQLAVNTMRARLSALESAGNEEELASYKSHIRDAMEAPQAKAAMLRYAKERAGKALENKTVKEQIDAWEQQLEKKLNRKPVLLDYYFDCMENYSYWGMTSEVHALSEALGVPILVFTIQEFNPKNNPQAKASPAKSSWMLGTMAGYPAHRDKAPLLLYFNGVDHYMDLVAR